MSLQPNDAAKAVDAIANHVPDKLETLLMWLSGIAAAFGISRGIIMRGSKDLNGLKADQTVRDQIDTLNDTIKEQAERLHKLGEKIGALRDIELEGAGDVAVMGVYIEQIEQRTCKNLKDCSATLPVENMGLVYNRINARRSRKEVVFAEHEAPAARKQKEASE